MTSIEAFDKIIKYLNEYHHSFANVDIETVEGYPIEKIRKELKAFEIIKKYPEWKGSILYLLYMSYYWKEGNRTITKELLENYDFPFEVEEFDLLREVL